MKWIVFSASLIAAATSISVEPVIASDLADVVRARANARAGGGTSGHDAWVLKRHGKLSGSRTRKTSAKKRALLAAKKKKAAAAKRRAYLIAKKKKQAQKRALIAAKKKEAAKKRALLVAKKKAAQKKRAQLAAQKKAEAQKNLAQARQTDNLERTAAVTPAMPAETNEKTESSFVPAPSTTALIASQEIDVAPHVPPTPVTSGKIATADKSAPQVNTVEVTSDPATLKSAQQDTASDAEGCKKFLPAIGLTVSVGC